MTKRILSSEEVGARIANFNRSDLDKIHVLYDGSMLGSLYSNFSCILNCPLKTIFEALEDNHHTFIETKEEQ